MAEVAAIIRLCYFPGSDEQNRRWRFQFFQDAVLPRLRAQTVPVDVWVWVHEDHVAEAQAIPGVNVFTVNTDGWSRKFSRTILRGYPWSAVRLLPRYRYQMLLGSDDLVGPQFVEASLAALAGATGTRVVVTHHPMMLDIRTNRLYRMEEWNRPSPFFILQQSVDDDNYTWVWRHAHNDFQNHVDTVLYIPPKHAVMAIHDYNDGTGLDGSRGQIDRAAVPWLGPVIPPRLPNRLRMADTAIIIRLAYASDYDPAARAWRFRWFAERTLPLLLAQGDDVDIWVWVNPEHRAEVEAMHPRIKTFVADHVTPLDARIPWTDALPRYPVQVRMDSDDLLSPEFTRIALDRLSVMPADRRGLVWFQPYKVDIRTGAVYPCAPTGRPYSNTRPSAFLALSQPVTHPQYDWVYGIGHTEAHILADVVDHVAAGSCAAACHTHNDSTAIGPTDRPVAPQQVPEWLRGAARPLAVTA